jgi:hypothetical protein
MLMFLIQSVILEKDKEVTTDPRGVFLTGDAVRILHLLGIGDEMANIGHGGCLHEQEVSTKRMS